MAPKRAVAYILSFELPADEAACIIECDVRRKSYAQVCDALHLSPEAQADLEEVKAYIAEELENPGAALATISRVTKKQFHKE